MIATPNNNSKVKNRPDYTCIYLGLPHVSLQCKCRNFHNKAIHSHRPFGCDGEKALYEPTSTNML